MAKPDEIFTLARAALYRDHAKALATVCCIAANEAENSALKKRLQGLIDVQSRNPSSEDNIRLDNGLEKLVQIRSPSHDLDQVVLPDDMRLRVADLLTEQRYADALAAHNLHPRNRLLLMGPPGTGKTVLAGAIARALDLPFLVVDYGSLITSYMGETGGKIGKLLDGLAGQPCVLFLDEMETILAERSGNPERSDVGEQARIVSTLLLAMDRLDHRVLFGVSKFRDGFAIIAARPQPASAKWICPRPPLSAASARMWYILYHVEEAKETKGHHTTIRNRGVVRI